MKKIIVPTDFSVHAENSYQVAAYMAKKFGISIVLYHILNPYIKKILSYAAGFLPDSSVLPTDEQIENYVQEKLEEVQNNPVFEGIDVESYYDIYMDNNPGEEIVAKINPREHYMVVMGNSGDAGYRKTVANTVVRLSKIPVISVKGEYANFGLTKILMLTNFEEVDAHFVQRVRLIRENTDAEITVGYINTVTHFKESNVIEDLYNKFIKKFKLTNTKLAIYNSKSLERGITNLSKSLDADLIALITHGRTGMSHFINGSHTEELINHIDTPVLVYNEHDYLKRLHAYNEASYSQHAYTRGLQRKSVK